MNAKIEKWLQSMKGKSRFALMYEGADLFLSEDCIIAADVYDDYLIFRKLDAQLVPTDLFSVAIDTFNEWGVRYCADRIINAL